MNHWKIPFKSVIEHSNILRTAIAFINILELWKKAIHKVGSPSYRMGNVRSHREAKNEENRTDFVVVCFHSTNTKICLATQSSDNSLRLARFSFKLKVLSCHLISVFLCKFRTFNVIVRCVLFASSYDCLNVRLLFRFSFQMHWKLRLPMLGYCTTIRLFIHPFRFQFANNFNWRYTTQKIC